MEPDPHIGHIPDVTQANNASSVAEQTTDVELWRRVGGDASPGCVGENAAFATLFDRHVGAVVNYCAHRVGSYAAAEDLAAQVFLELWKSRERLTVSPPSALPLLFGISRNICSHYRTARGREHRAYARAPVELDRPDFADDAAHRLDAAGTLLAVQAALEALSHDHRVVVEYCLIAGASTADVALALDIPEGTVKSRLSRARSQLREALHDHPAVVCEEF